MKNLKWELTSIFGGVLLMILMLFVGLFLIPYISPSAQSWRYRGIKFNKESQFDMALNAFNKSIELEPENAETWFLKAGALIDLVRYEEALQAADKSIELGYTPALYTKSKVLLDLKRYDEAINACNEYLKLEPKNPSTLYTRAQAYSFKRDKTNTLNNLKQVVGINQGWKEKAKKDQAFEWLWEDKEFKKLTE